MGGAEAHLRKQGATGLFGWLKRVKWGNPGIAALAVSMLIFAIGGWNGTAETTLPLNMVSHNTMWVPAHLHQVVTGGTTVAFMGFAYYLIPLLVRRRLWGFKWATFQIYLYGVGMFVMTMAQSWAGTLGVPRRTWEIGYSGQAPSGWDLPMNIAGFGAGLSGVAGALFVVIMVATLLIGKRTDDPAELAPSGLA
jgi:cytochrome c oxidase subunit 1